MTFRKNDREAGAERESAALRQLRERLVAGGAYESSEVDAAVGRAVARLAGAPIREFVPVLVERLTTDDLRHTAATPERRLTSATEPGEQRPGMEGQS